MTGHLFNLTGDGVALGPLDHRLIETCLAWSNDFAAASTASDVALPMTLEECGAWYQRAAAGTDWRIVRFTVFDEASGDHVGLTNLHAINHGHGTAEFGLVIGEGRRGQGYGTRATRLMLPYAFDHLGLHNVMLRVYANNPAGVHAYDRARITEFGRRAGSRRLGSERHDEIFMECVVTSWRSTP